ncbi:prolyl oligopeptidase family serine peptidase [Bremerella cremea]|nr:prolyl oligopeptidase family serine peptidase [Bremerella cremea]
MPADKKRQATQRFTWTGTDGNQRSFSYWCYLPPDAPPTSRLPLLLFLHGAGERGNNLSLVCKHGPPKLIEQGEDFPFVVIAPQCPFDQWWTMPQNLIGLAKLVEQVSADYPIDPERMYVTGMSMGGYGTWQLAATYPKLFAAIVPICGGTNLSQAVALQSIPVWAFHGRDDDIVPLIRSQEIIDELTKIGSDATLTIYDNVRHDSWSATYANREIYDWLLTHKTSNSFGE